MADNNEESIRRETEAREAATKSTINTTKQLADAFEDLIERNKSAEDKLKKLNKELDTGKKRLVDIGPALEDLQDSIEKTTDVNKRAEMQAQLEQKRAQASSAQYTRMVVDSGAAILAAAGNFGVNLTKSVLSSYQSNASAFQTAGDIAAVSIDSAAQGFKGIAGAASVAGSGLMFLGPKGVAAGLALQAFGAGLTFLTEKFSDLAKFGINVAVKELETQTKAFAAATSVGALFSQGMDEMRRRAGEAGLTQEQFAKVIADNASTFAQFGGSVGAGAQQFARINAALGTGPNSLRQGLIKLGFSIEEIADGTAQYMAIQAASGQGQRRDYANLARETDAYLTNLRIISAFTGEDAKKKMEQARQASMQLAVDNRIRSMQLAGDTKARERFMSSIGILPDRMQKAATQIFEFGAITDPELAAAFYPNKEAMMVLTESVRLAKDGNLDAKQATEAMIATQKQAQKTAFEANKDFGTAVGRSTLAIGANSNITAAMQESQLYLTKTQDELGKTVTQTADDQKKNTAKLSEETAAATVAMQNMRIDIQDKLTPAITDFAKLTRSIIEGLEKQLRDLKIFGTSAAPSATPGAGTPSAPYQSPAKTTFEKRKKEYEERKTSAVGGPEPVVSATGLKIKPGAEAEGPATDIVYQVAQQVHNLLGGDYRYFSGLRDRGIDKSASHGAGRAFDLVLNDPTRYAGVLANIKSMEQVQFAQFERKGQVNPNGSVATGDHIHAEVKAAQGAIVPATTGGVDVKVAEGGASEVIAPLKNGRLPGMDEMIQRLDQMISVLKDQRDTSEKIFQATI